MNIEKNLITVLSPTLRYGDVEITGTDGLAIRHGVTAVHGPNGSGKTTLGIILGKGRYAFGNRLAFDSGDITVKLLQFTDIHSFTGVDVLRYDQRLESSENDFVPTVGDVMGASATTARWHGLCHMFGLHGAEDKKINFLSSGELRKLLLINALLDTPGLLVLDNPITGNNPQPSAPDDDEILLPEAPREHPTFATAFAIRDGVLRYGDKIVQSGIDWCIERGQRWALTGPNGSGKSLLLSIVCGDNPQAYSNDVTIFDRRRGSGESIWEIKDNIGYVCPEMQLYFKSPYPVERIVVEGMRPWLKRFGAPTADELRVAREWLGLLGIRHLAERKFDTLSSAEQRLVLLARAFVRQPALLILDEPFQGLDRNHKERLRRVIDQLAGRRGCTLIFVTHYPAELPSSVDHTKSLTR
ncbi:MAG: ATP-binding cassette domain-containing protein [Muribaculaceae bacterium]|nr:ATP-binding cassette domain-containing protein [Muribaculaceae bacterium]